MSDRYVTERRYDIEMMRGDAFRRSINIDEPDDSDYDLTGATVWFTLKRAGDTAADDSGAIAQLTWESGGASNGIVVTNPAIGRITVVVPKENTALLNPAAKYRYDVQVVNVSGEPDTPIWGEVTVIGDVTRSTVLP